MRVSVKEHDDEASVVAALDAPAVNALRTAGADQVTNPVRTAGTDQVTNPLPQGPSRFITSTPPPSTPSALLGLTR